jgi:Tol biopolymer transport system component
MEQPVTDQLLHYSLPRLSPDGRKIAYRTYGREWQVWVYDLNRGTTSRLTTEGRADYPTWAPDGKRLLFSWRESVAGNLFWQPYDGSSPMERLTTSERTQYAGSWSPDGKTVALVEESPEEKMKIGYQWDINMLDVGTGRVTPFLNSPFNERYPDFSPDGRWIAYTSDESNREEVYVRPFPGPGMKYLISSEGGREPLWAKDGKQLYYRRLDTEPNQVWAVDVRTDGGFAAAKPRLLFDKSGYSTTNPIRGYDLSLDGQRFLMVKVEDRKPSPITEMILVQNWFEELKRLVPGDKKF